MEPRFNEAPTDWGNCLAVSRVRCIENLGLTNLRTWNNQYREIANTCRFLFCFWFCFFFFLCGVALEYCTLFLKREGQISVEVTGKQRNKALD